MQKNPLSWHYCDNSISDWVLNNCGRSRKQLFVFIFQLFREKFGLSAPKVMQLCDSELIPFTAGGYLLGLNSGNLLVFFATRLTVLACNSIDSAIVALSMSYTPNVSNNDFVVHGICITQLIRHQSPLFNSISHWSKPLRLVFQNWVFRLLEKWIWYNCTCRFCNRHL